MDIAGPAAEALKSLDAEQIKFIEQLPKAELHAHLNGSIPFPVLQELAEQYKPASEDLSGDVVQAGVALLKSGPDLNEIHDFFSLFPAIYALTSTPSSLARATRGVLSYFLDGDPPQCQYLELRTTPKATPAMNREQYLRVVLGEVAKYGKDRAGLIVSMDRKMQEQALGETIELAKKLKSEGECVVGIDLCGDPTAGDVVTFTKYIKDARHAGLGVTLHIAETIHNSPEETLHLLACLPNRLGHATFLNEEARDIVMKNNACVEICLTSNLLCKTVTTLDLHHIRHYLQEKHPIAICTDDILPFRTSMTGEYALLMAKPPMGLGLSNDEVATISQMSMNSRFRNTSEPASRIRHSHEQI